MSYNKVMLIGNVGQDPDLKYQDFEPHHLEKASFSIATTERYRNKEGEVKQVTEWHRIVAHVPIAGIVASHVKKGLQVFIEGSLMTRTFDREGQKHFITEIHVTNLQLLRKTESDIGS